MARKKKEVYQLNDFTKMDPRDEMTIKMKETVYAIEANDYELHRLWLQHAKQGAKYIVHVDPLVEARYRGDWKQDTSGWLPCIGRLNAGGSTKYPVSMSCNWYIINGKRVLFFYQSGRWCDHDMSRAWIATHMPHLFPNGVERVGHFGDAQNFHNCLHYIAELNKSQVVF